MPVSLYNANTALSRVVCSVQQYNRLRRTAHAGRRPGILAWVVAVEWCLCSARVANWPSVVFRVCTQLRRDPTRVAGFWMVWLTVRDASLVNLDAMDPITDLLRAWYPHAWEAR